MYDKNFSNNNIWCITIADSSSVSANGNNLIDVTNLFSISSNILGTFDTNSVLYNNEYDVEYVACK